MIVNVYLKNINDINLNEKDYENISDYLKNKSNNSNKDRYIISLKEEKFLKEIINIKDKLNIETNKYNKPYLVNSDIKYNFSNKGNYFTLAISEDEVGIDIEEVKENSNSKLYEFIKQHHSDFKNNSPKLIWTMIESSIKLLGISSLIFKEIEIINIKKEDEHNYLFITKYKDILMYGKAKIINDLFMSVCTYNENFEIIYY